MIEKTGFGTGELLLVAAGGLAFVLLSAGETTLAVITGLFAVILGGKAAD